MLTFKKYSSIENHFDAAFMEKVRNHTPTGTRFVVQEKVHGSIKALGGHNYQLIHIWEQ